MGRNSIPNRLLRHLQLGRRVRRWLMCRDLAGRGEGSDPVTSTTGNAINERETVAMLNRLGVSSGDPGQGAEHMRWSKRE